MRIIDFAALILSTRWFVDREETHQAELKKTAEGWGTFDRGDFEERTAKKRHGYAISLLLVAAVLGSGVSLALIVNQLFPVSLFAHNLVRLLAVAVVAWAVLSRLGYETETWKGVTLLETTSLFGFKLTYLVGLLLSAVALFLVPAG